ncbi:MAG: exodeoxyribonuclease VII large subunit [Candidatus Altiarchaeota archaeon]|nr:exodeoxyribonuclease VII large subunit [Candidatus Altiarchaeota archaeon]
MGDVVLRLALCTSIVGLMVLAVVSESLEPPYSMLRDVSTGSVGKNVRIAGTLSGIHAFKGGSLLLTLADGNGSVDVFVPYSAARNLGFKPSAGQSIDVIGSVEIYNGRLEISVEEPARIRLVEDESNGLDDSGA